MSTTTINIDVVNAVANKRYSYVLAMRKEKQIQEATQKQRQEARNAEMAQKFTAAKLQAEEALKKQQSLVKAQNHAALQVNTSSKIPPPRPRSRPQGSPVKQPLNMFNVDFSKIEKDNTKEENNSFVAFSNQSPGNTDNVFKADFSAFEEQAAAKPTEGLFDVDFSAEMTKAPQHSIPPIVSKETPKIEPPVDSKKKQKEEEKRRKEEEKKRKKEEEARKKEEVAKKKEEESQRKVEFGIMFNVLSIF